MVEKWEQKGMSEQQRKRAGVQTTEETVVGAPCIVPAAVIRLVAAIITVTLQSCATEERPIVQ